MPEVVDLTGGDEIASVHVTPIPVAFAVRTTDSMRPTCVSYERFAPVHNMFSRIESDTSNRVLDATE